MGKSKEEFEKIRNEMENNCCCEEEYYINNYTEL
jgi:hypothetical protein